MHVEGKTPIAYMDYMSLCIARHCPVVNNVQLTNI